MEEIKELEYKIQKDQRFLKELKERKFNRNNIVEARKEKKNLKQAEWRTIKKIIKSYIKLCQAKNKQVIISQLAIAIGKDNKTAKKYYLLVCNNQELKYRYNSKSAWNSQEELKAQVVDKLAAAIERTDKHMGTKVMLSLADLIDDIAIDFKNHNLKYSTIYKWIRNNPMIDYKYSSKKRRRTLKRIKIVTQRIEENKAALHFLRIVKGQKIKQLIVEETIKKLNENKKDTIKPDKESFMNPGLIVQIDGGQDIIYQKMKVNRQQVVDVMGYSYAIIYTPTETNKAYILALIEILKLTWPIIILVDRRKGIDTSDAKALVAAICKNLDITVIASSDPNHKALVEKDHGLIRSRASLYFSRHNIQTLEQANSHASKINDAFNQKHNYVKPKQNGQKISNAILDFLHWDLKVAIPYNTNFIYFEKDAYQIIEDNGQPMYIDTNEIYVVGSNNNQVKVLFKKHLYRTKLIPKINLTSKEFANSLLRTKFQKNPMIVMTKESARFWIESETKSIAYFTEKKLKNKYQSKMTKLFQENYMLKEKLRKSTS